MKIISFNINSVRARPHQVEHLRDTLDPDVIGLQETKVNDPEFPTDYSHALLEAIQERVGEDRTKTAMKSLSDKTDAAEIALWICDFFLQAQPASRLPLAASLA